MTKPFKILIVVVVLLAEIAWFVWPRISLNGDVGEPYRHDERLKALEAWGEHPTPESKVAYDAEVKLLDEHMAREEYEILAVAIVLDAVGIYCLFAQKRNMAK